MDVSRQVLRRSIRMGLSYVALSLIMGIFLSLFLNIGARVGEVASSNGRMVDIGSLLGLLVVPMGALVGLIITTPVYLLFVSDKNAGVLEYLLAVGMDQRDIFWGYLKASMLLSLLAIVPVLVINTAFMNAGLTLSLAGAALALVTGIADVALVTVLMSSFSSMQRRPTGMNSPLGISIGVVFLMPEFFLISVLGSAIIWVEVGVAAVLVASVAGLMLSLQKLIMRERLLP